jgi:hypothetical protein
VTVPESLPQVLIFIAMLVPGFSFVTVRTWYVGWRSPDYGPGSRILEALYVSAIFLVVYTGTGLLIHAWIQALSGVGTLRELQPWLEGAWKETASGLVAVLGIVLLVVVPGGVAALMSRRTKVTVLQDDGTAVVVSKAVNRNQSMPRGWDHAAFGADEPRFARVLTHTGVYVGGWYGPGSYSSTFPYDKDIFISNQWRMGSDGAFIEPMPDSLGVWVPITDQCQVEWIADTRNREHGNEEAE